MSYPASLLSCFCMHTFSQCQFTTAGDLIRNGLSPFSLKPNLKCYRYFLYLHCSHLLGTSYMAIKVCISFLLSKDNLSHLYFPKSCRWFWRYDSMCLINPLQSLEELSSELKCYVLTIWGREEEDQW